MGFPRQEYWSGLPFPPPGDLPHPGTEPVSPAAPALQVDSLPTEPPGKPFCIYTYTYFMYVFTYAHVFMYTYIYASVHTYFFFMHTPMFCLKAEAPCGLGSTARPQSLQSRPALVFPIGPQSIPQAAAASVLLLHFPDVEAEAQRLSCHTTSPR